MFFFSVQLNAEDRDSIVTLNASLNKHIYIYITQNVNTNKSFFLPFIFKEEEAELTFQITTSIRIVLIWLTKYSDVVWSQSMDRLQCKVPITML